MAGGLLVVFLADRAWELARIFDRPGPAGCITRKVGGRVDRRHPRQLTVLSIIKPILVNTVLTTPLSVGIAATAAIATIPAANAYSTKSCPRVSRQKLCKQRFIVYLPWKLENLCVIEVTRRRFPRESVSPLS